MALSKKWHVFERIAAPSDKRGDCWVDVGKFPGGLSEDEALEKARADARCSSNLLLAFKPASVAR